jgi:putative transposase
VWNWALAEWSRQYEAGEKPTALKLKKHFNEIRREHFPWTWARRRRAFFEGKARRPRFKSKKRSKASFYLANDQLELGDHRMWVPKRGWVNMAENLCFTGKVTGARITETADWWFVSLTVELPETLPEQRQAAVGIDVGLNRLATLSTGEGYENQAFLKTALKKLRQANKRLHRRKLGSKNREKARCQVARLHYRFTCLRDDLLHELTTGLADCYGIIGIEDLNIKGLLKNRRVSRSFSGAALGKLVSLLDAKVEQCGGQVVKVGRFFPSSKSCHSCGWKWEDMELTDRVFLCQNPHCAFHHCEQDRDLVFGNAIGDYRNPATTTQAFHRLLARAGLPRMRIHDLRHSAATLLIIVMKMPANLVQELLGHDDIETTLGLYTHPDPEMHAR